MKRAVWLAASLFLAWPIWADVLEEGAGALHRRALRRVGR